MRNSISPISIGKAQRFQQPTTATGQTPFYDSHLSFSQQRPYKKGFGFGYSRRVLMGESKDIAISPERYFSPQQSQFFKPKLYNKCTFGESYDKLSKKCDIENRKVLAYVNFEKVSPQSYIPDIRKVKRQANAFSCSSRYPRMEEIQELKQPCPGPQKYNVNDKFVRSERYVNILAGGSSPKNGLIINKNPGPGQYDPQNFDIQQFNHKSKQLSSTFASATGKSWLSHVPSSMKSSPRECALGLPGQGEPFNHMGALKERNQRNLEDLFAKTQTYLKFKRNTINYIDKLTNTLSREENYDQQIQ